MPNNRKPVPIPETPWARRASERALSDMGPAHSAKIADVAVKLAEICARADQGLSDADAAEIIAAMRRPDGFGPTVSFLQKVRDERYARRMGFDDRNHAAGHSPFAFASSTDQPYGIANNQSFCPIPGPELPRAASKQQTASGIPLSDTPDKPQDRRPIISPTIIRDVRENDPNYAKWYAGCLKKYDRRPSWREESAQFYRMGYLAPTENQIEAANKKPGKKD